MAEIWVMPQNAINEYIIGGIGNIEKPYQAFVMRT